MAFRHAPRLITAADPEFYGQYGKELADQVLALCASPEQQAKAKAAAEELERQKAQREAQLLKEICDGADNKVYGKEGQEIASRFPPEADGKRSYYMQVGLKEALAKAGLLGRRSPRRGR